MSILVQWQSSRNSRPGVLESDYLLDPEFLLRPIPTPSACPILLAFSILDGQAHQTVASEAAGVGNLTLKVQQVEADDSQDVSVPLGNTIMRGSPANQA